MLGLSCGMWLLTVCVYVFNHFCHVWLFETPWTIAHQAPLSMGFSRQEYWNGLLWPPPGESSWPRDWTCASWVAGRFVTPWATWVAQALSCCMWDLLGFLHWELGLSHWNSRVVPIFILFFNFIEVWLTNNCHIFKTYSQIIWYTYTWWQDSHHQAN